MYTTSKEMNVLISGLVREGWSYSKKGKHPRVTHPCGRFVTLALTPSDSRRAFLNFRSDVNRLKKTIEQKETAAC